MINNPYQAYNNTSVMTATPGELTLMLYNGAIRFAKQAKQEIAEHNIEQINYYCQKAQAILVELMSTLKMEYDIAKELHRLYDFMYRHLLQANIKKSEPMIQEVIELLEDLRNTWSEAIKIARTGQQAVGMDR
ncbi:MAG: flagellar export chaperone FliS [Tumebacillaceae bacterium]